MPGHVKLGKAGEPDPDPCPYLVISMDMKRADMLKPYDSKKSYWGPDGTGGFREGLLEADHFLQAARARSIVHCACQVVEKSWENRVPKSFLTVTLQSLSQLTLVKLCGLLMKEI